MATSRLLLQFRPALDRRMVRPVRSQPVDHYGTEAWILVNGNWLLATMHVSVSTHVTATSDTPLNGHARNRFLLKSTLSDLLQFWAHHTPLAMRPSTQA